MGDPTASTRLLTLATLGAIGQAAWNSWSPWAGVTTEDYNVGDSQDSTGIDPEVNVKTDNVAQETLEGSGEDVENNVDAETCDGYVVAALDLPFRSFGISPAWFACKATGYAKSGYNKIPEGWGLPLALAGITGLCWLTSKSSTTNVTVESKPEIHVHFPEFVTGSPTQTLAGKVTTGEKKESKEEKEARLEIERLTEEARKKAIAEMTTGSNAAAAAA